MSPNIIYFLISSSFLNLQIMKHFRYTGNHRINGTELYIDGSEIKHFNIQE